MPGGAVAAGRSGCANGGNHGKYRNFPHRQIIPGPGVTGDKVFI
jgi:hypothetical protein